MSKIGRKPILIDDVKISIVDKMISYKGINSQGTYFIPNFLDAEIINNQLFIKSNNFFDKRLHNSFWGMHRVLLANKIEGSRKEFVKELIIEGLGFKGELKGNKIIFSLGYSHKIDFEILKDVKVEIDKTGQNIILKSYDKLLVGNMGQQIRALRLPEPYKGTGIRFSDEVLFRKSGKTKGE